MNELALKIQLLEACKEFVNQQENTILNTIVSHQHSLDSETKSSAGDKHETGRAMLQLEMEKAGKQLQSMEEIRQILSKIDITTSTKIAHLGSVVITNFGNYFLAIAVGKITLENQDFFAISLASPIGKILLGKKTNDSFLFNQKTYQIKEVF